MQILSEGKKAPNFKGIDQNGNSISLTDFKEQKLVLYFYPQDNTPTCTEQACNLRDNYSLLTKNGYAIVGVSPDDVTKHKKFETKFKLPFTLIADIGNKIISKYGVWAEKQMFGNIYMGVVRTTFVIDEKGYIRKIIQRPKVKQHAAEILEAMKDE
jgi:thioredoxin-dependent peroxiredoxin